MRKILIMLTATCSLAFSGSITIPVPIEPIEIQESKALTEVWLGASITSLERNCNCSLSSGNRHVGISARIAYLNMFLGYQSNYAQLSAGYKGELNSNIYYLLGVAYSNDFDRVGGYGGVGYTTNGLFIEEVLHFYDNDLNTMSTNIGIKF